LFTVTMEAFIEIINKKQFGPKVTSQKEKYLLKCIENIKEKKSSCQSILILDQLIKWENYHQITQKVISEVINPEEGQNVLDLVIDDLKHYFDMAHQLPKTKTKSSILIGRYNHEKNISSRLLIMESLV